MKRRILGLFLILLFAGIAFGSSYRNTEHKHLECVRTMTGTGGDSADNILYYDTATTWGNNVGSIVKMKWRYKVDSVFTGDTLIWKITTWCIKPNLDHPSDTGFMSKLYEDTITDAATTWSYDSILWDLDTVIGGQAFRFEFISIDSTEDDSLSGNTYRDSLELIWQSWE